MVLRKIFCSSYKDVWTVVGFDNVHLHVESKTGQGEVDLGTVLP